MGVEAEWIRGVMRRWSKAEMHGRGEMGNRDQGRKRRGKEADFAKMECQQENSDVGILNPWEGGGEIIFVGKRVPRTVVFEVTRGGKETSSCNNNEVEWREYMIWCISLITLGGSIFQQCFQICFQIFINGESDKYDTIGDR